MRLGQEFGGYARAVARDRERVARAAEGLRRLGIGGTATGTGLNAHPEYHARMVAELSRLTGLKLLPPTTCSSRCSRWPTRPISRRAAHNTAITLVRIANDLRLLVVRPDHRPG